MGAPGAPASGEGPATVIDAWRPVPAILLAVSVVLPLVLAILGYFDGTTDASNATVGLALAVAFAVWSVVLRNRVCEDDDPDGLRWNLVYLAGAYGLFFGLTTVSPHYLFLLFLLMWRTFSLLRLTLAIPAAIVVLGLGVVGQVVHGGVDDVGSAVVSAVISLVFAIATGVFIGRVIDQSRDRAALIDELRATRDELAVANHAAGVQAERERMAHEIHDTLAQGYTSIVMLLQGVDAALSGETGDGRPDVDRARAGVSAAERTARDNLAEARNLVGGMLPAPLEHDSLAGALGRLAERTGADLGIEVPCVVTGDERVLEPAKEVALLRIAQEAVANARHHATPQRIELRLDYGTSGGPVTLVVADDGRGFDPDTVTPGVGLRGMRRRLADPAAGGTDEVGDLRVESAPGAGTRVTAVVA